MKWIAVAFRALSWADHLDEAGWYRNKRYFAQLLGVIVSAVALFGVDLGLSAEEKAAVAGGIVALIDVISRAVGRKIDAIEETLPDEIKPRRAPKSQPPPGDIPNTHDLREERQRRRSVGKTTR